MCISKLTNDHGIQFEIPQLIGQTVPTTANQYRDSVAASYIDGIISNTKSRFSDNSLKLVVSFSCFDPSLFPSDDSSFFDYGNDRLKTLVEFYGNEQTTTFEGTTCTSPPLIDSAEVYTEWKELLSRKAEHWLKQTISQRPFLRLLRISIEGPE